MIEIKKWKCGRHWALYRDGELLAVIAYKRGAIAVARALDAIIYCEVSEPRRHYGVPPICELLN